MFQEMLNYFCRMLLASLKHERLAGTIRPTKHGIIGKSGLSNACLVRAHRPTATFRNNASGTLLNKNPTITSLSMGVHPFTSYYHIKLRIYDKSHVQCAHYRYVFYKTHVHMRCKPTNRAVAFFCLLSKCIC